MFALLSRSLQQFAALIMTLLAARFLSISEFGLYALGVVFFMLVQTMTYTGFYHFIVTSKEASSRVLPTSFWMILALGTGATIVISALAYPLELLFDMEGLGMVIFLLVLPQPISSICSWASAVMLRRQRVQENFTVMFWQSLIALIGGVIVIYIWQTIYALFVYRYLRVILGVVLYYAAGLRFPGWQLDKLLARKALSYSSGLYGSRMLAFLSKYSADLLLGLYFAAAEVGVYRFGQRIASSASDILLQPLSNFAISQFGARARQDKSLKGSLEQFAGSMALLTGILSAVIVVFTEDVLSAFFREAYLAALIVTYAISVRGVAAVGQYLAEPVFSAIDKTGWVMRMNFVLAILSIVTALIAIPFGVQALAWSQAGLALGSSLWAFYLIQKKGGIEIGGALRNFIIGILLAIAFGIALGFARMQIVQTLGLEGIMIVVVGLAIAALMLPLTLFVAWRLRVFNLSVFSG